MCSRIECIEVVRELSPRYYSHTPGRLDPTEIKYLCLFNVQSPKMGSSIIPPAAQNLPPDIIREIFSYFSSKLQVHASKTFPWHLGHICSAWRAAFFAMTMAFWRPLAIDYRNRSLPDPSRITRIVEITRFFVDRNREETISFDYLLLKDGDQQSTPGPDLRAVLDLLVEESMRWEFVSIETAPLDLPTLLRVKDRVSSLRSLKLRIPTQRLSNDTLDMFENAPSLQQVALVEYFNWKLNWSSLTTLELWKARFEQDELSVLSQALNVETLTIQHLSESSPEKHGGDSGSLTIRLPRLKSLSLHGNSRFLTVLETPKLDELKLEFHVGGNLGSITSFLSRSSCKILRLTLKSIAKAAFADILRSTPELIHLEFRGHSDLLYYLNVLDPSVINSARGGGEKLVRRMKSLTISPSPFRPAAWPYSPQELDRLMKLVKSRNELGGRDGYAERLERLTVTVPLVQKKLHSLAELETLCQDTGVAFRCNFTGLQKPKS